MKVARVWPDEYRLCSDESYEPCLRRMVLKALEFMEYDANIAEHVRKCLVPTWDIGKVHLVRPNDDRATAAMIEAMHKAAAFSVTPADRMMNDFMQAAVVFALLALDNGWHWLCEIQPFKWTGKPRMVI